MSFCLFKISSPPLKKNEQKTKKRLKKRGSPREGVERFFFFILLVFHLSSQTDAKGVDDDGDGEMGEKQISPTEGRKVGKFFLCRLSRRRRREKARRL